MGPARAELCLVCHIGTLPAGDRAGALAGAGQGPREAQRGGGEPKAPHGTALLQVLPKKLSTTRALEQPSPGGLPPRPSRIPVRRKGVAAGQSLTGLRSDSTAALQAWKQSCGTPRAAQPPPGLCQEAPAPGTGVQTAGQIFLCESKHLHPKHPPGPAADSPSLSSYRQLLSFCAEA